VKGWPIVRLAEEVSINPKLPKKIDPRQSVSFVPMAAVDEIHGAIADRQDKTFEVVSKGFPTFINGDVLFAKITPCMENGKAAIASDLVNGIGAGSTEFFVLRPSRNVLPEYIFHFVRRRSFRESCKANFTGSAGQQRVPRSYLENVQFRLPPLDEQRRIVSLLDRAADIRRRADAARAKARAIIPALFLDMFGDPATNPKGWAVARLGDLLSRIDSGWSPVCGDGQPNNSEWGVLKLSAVKSFGFFGREAKCLKAGVSPRNDLEVQAGDLLFTRKNTLDLVGTAAIADSTSRFRMLPDTIFRLVPAAPQKVDGIYLCTMINLSSYRPVIRQLAAGAAASMPGISKGRLSSLTLPLPPLPLQAAFAEQARRIEATARALDAAAAKAEAMAAALSHDIFG